MCNKLSDFTVSKFVIYVDELSYTELEPLRPPQATQGLTATVKVILDQLLTDTHSSQLSHLW